MNYYFWILHGSDCGGLILTSKQGFWNSETANNEKDAAKEIALILKEKYSHTEGRELLVIKCVDKGHLFNTNDL